MNQVTIASHYGISLSDVRSLRIWEFNILIAHRDKAIKAQQTNKAGMTPVMT